MVPSLKDLGLPARAHVDAAFVSEDGSLAVIGWLYDPGRLVSNLILIDRRTGLPLEGSADDQHLALLSAHRVWLQRVARSDVTQAMFSLGTVTDDDHGIVLVVPYCPPDSWPAFALKDGRIAALPFAAMSDPARFSLSLKRHWHHSGPSLDSLIQQTLPLASELARLVEAIKHEEQHPSHDVSTGGESTQPKHSPNQRNLLPLPRHSWSDLSKAARSRLNAAIDGDVEFIYETVAAAFDAQHYANSYPDVAEATDDLVSHYLLTGTAEGRNPTKTFDTVFYLRTNADVREAGVNPFYHFVVQGYAEGRQPSPAIRGIGEDHTPTDSPTSGASTSTDAIDKSPGEARYSVDFLAWKNAVSFAFSPEYYLRRYQDVADAQVDPFEHYFFEGWREGRRPCWNFDPQDYLRRYPDVANAQIEPFFHYLTAGAREGRVPYDDLLDNLDQLKAAPVFSRMTGGGDACPPSPAPAVSDLDSLKHRLTAIAEQRSPKGIVIAVSHDNVLATLGGIQNCVRDEQQAMTAGGWMHVHLYPLIPTLSVEEHASADHIVGINVDGVPLGLIGSSQLVELISSVHAGHSMPAVLVIHSLLGHSVEPLVRLAKQLSAKSYLWLHDYAYVCSNFLLTRNEMEFCGAPPVDSDTCRICSFGTTRADRLRLTKRLMTDLSPTMVSPSRYTEQLFINRTKSDGIRIPTRVIPHTDFISTDNPTPADDCRPLPDTDDLQHRPLRIAYLGYDSYHKGTAAWRHVLRKLGDNPGLRFFHLGQTDSLIDFVEYRNVVVSASQRDAMIDAVAADAIDFVILWPNWPETYSYVAHEAIAGGAQLLTNPLSGNIAELTKQRDAGLVFHSLEDLVQALSGDQAVLRTSLQRKPRTLYRLRYTPGCANLIMARASS